MYGTDPRLSAEKERELIQNSTKLFTIDIYYSNDIRQLGIPCLAGYDINKMACSAIPGLTYLIENTIRDCTDKFADNFIQLMLNPPSEEKSSVIDVEPVEPVDINTRTKRVPKKYEIPDDDKLQEDN